MKRRKFLGVLLAMNMWIVAVVPAVYGEEVVQEGNVANPIVVEQVMPQTWQIESRKICEVLGVSPMLLPPDAKCTDGYIGRLKVMGLIDAKQTIDPNATMTGDALQKLIDEMQRYQLGGHAGSDYIKKLEKANPNWEKVKLGQLAMSKSVLSFQDSAYPLYEIAGTSFVRVGDLKNMGLNVTWNENSISIDLGQNTMSTPSKAAILEGDVYAQTQPCRIGNLQTYSVSCKDETLIPVRALGSLFDVKIEAGQITLENPNLAMGSEIAIKERTLTNTTQTMLSLQLTSYYWDGKGVQTLVQTVEKLEPGQEMQLPWDYYSLVAPNTKYITTLVDEVRYGDEWGGVITANDQRYDQYGQANLAYFQAYEKGKQAVITHHEQVETLFPASVIIGTMKYDTNGLKKGAQVEVWAAEKGIHYKVISGGKKIIVPWNSVSIPSNPAVNKKAATKEELETYINSKRFTSKTDYLVWTDLHRQRTYVFKKQDERWVLHRDMLCSTGNNKTPTPRGEFTLTSYVPAFGMNKGYMCKNAVGIFEDYLYHSVMFDKTGSYELTGVGNLGNQASSGCIRLSYDNSVWFYKNMPLGTKVWIN
ncbi:MAG: L,D-transpeptidase [Cellulosilyticaceae bacterium]